jgi:hypothetical protein
MDRGVRLANERLTEIIYKALLRELDYSEDFDLAELEITLEGDGKLEDFQKRFEEIHGQPWVKRRLLGLALNEASAVLHDLDPGTYSTPDSYSSSVGSGRADIDPNKLANGPVAVRLFVSERKNSAPPATFATINFTWMNNERYRKGGL